MTTYHEITGSRRYEYRYYTEDGSVVGWIDAGPADTDTLPNIAAGFTETEEYDVRETCEMADDTGTYVGRLIFSKLVYRQ